MAATYTIDSEGLRHYKGKSTHDKETGNVPNGSDFYEMDTGDVYMFDAETRTWIQQ